MSAGDNRVPFVDLGRQHEAVSDRLIGGFVAGLERGDFVLGGELERFEADWAEYLGTRHCVGLASGTSALSIALSALGIGPGDEVIVPAHTFIASALGVVHAGAEPVLCDVDAETGLVDLDSAATLVGPRTAALMVVHLYGQVCDMEAATTFARDRGIALVEDSAQAHGAEWGGRKAGSFGDTAAFSFYPSKNLGALGDGGALVTSDQAVADRARALRHLGQRAKGIHDLLGFNERLDTLQAAFLRTKLAHLDDWNEQRRRAASLYRERLEGEADLLPIRERADDVFHIFAIRTPAREAVAERLGAEGVETAVHYPAALHQHRPLRGARHAPLAAAEAWVAEELSLPMFPGITDREVARVCDVLRSAIAEIEGSAELPGKATAR
jgi:dTDP-4-amino-4,6-dideoxygalactose transaminase